jgi:hypothetical protein
MEEEKSMVQSRVARYSHEDLEIKSVKSGEPAESVHAEREEDSDLDVNNPVSFLQYSKATF